MQPPDIKLQGELNTKETEFAQKCAIINGRLTMWKNISVSIFEILTEYKRRSNIKGTVSDPLSKRVTFELPYADYFPAASNNPGNFLLMFEINDLALIEVSGYNPMDSSTIQLSDYPFEPHSLKEKDVIGYLCKFFESLNLYLSQYSELDK